MIQLVRTVRFCLGDAMPPTPGAAGVLPGAGAGARAGKGRVEASSVRQLPQSLPRHNTYSAWPPMRGLGRFYQIRVTVADSSAKPDPLTGFLVNIKDIDQAVRDHAVPCLAALTRPAEAPMGSVMRQLMLLIACALPRRIAAVRLDLTPFYALEIARSDMDHVLIRQQFEFSAAHRLHVPRLSAAENRRVFGKCNNPAGHGHNYQLEVAVRAPIDRAGHTLDISEVDAVVDRHVIQQLDHKHLNLDVAAFSRVNPTVENIAKVIFGLLRAPLRRRGARLKEVSVWETPKTVCVYRGRE